MLNLKNTEQWKKLKKTFFHLGYVFNDFEYPNVFNKELPKNGDVVVIKNIPDWDIALYFDHRAHVLIKRKKGTKWGELIHHMGTTELEPYSDDFIITRVRNLYVESEVIYITYSKWRIMEKHIKDCIYVSHKSKLIRYIRSRKLRGTTLPQETASITDFPFIFTETDWGYIAGTKRGDKPVYYLDKNIQASFLDLGLFKPSFLILHNVRIKVVSNQIDYNDLRDLLGSRTRHRYSISAGGNKTLAIAVDDNIFSKVGIPHIVDHTTNGNGHWIALADVTNYDLTKIEILNI